METAVDTRPRAWLPLTPRGVAAFAAATCGRLLVVQAVVAALAAAALLWFLSTAWFPLVLQGIRQMPPHGEIRIGRLDWQGNSPALLAQGRFLSWAVDLNHAGEARSPADIQVEFGREDVQIRSLFGFTRWEYQVRWAIPFNRPELEPWWGAWAPALLAITAGATLFGLPIIWAVLATVYTLPVWLMGFFTDRSLGWGGSWRLAGAALMPGALFLSAVILAYGNGSLDLVQLLLAGAVHWVIGWIYLPLAVGKIPKLSASSTPRGDPFRNPKTAEK